ncbi:hypothetical protein KMZ68_24035 [Bradyrhizobium sediminis]|uniref:Uncharacterized protein n=1 Tax=Bradyrhizobium sediminis TaxID=2840469 RepID=A0A975RSF8_9BRAD|nr:hypothetical protein [Bradyrhizobium sediminis]QWG17984.1 hypothetical protein KMZ68_24035 [Bradyrhizobium sediminis]
MPGAAPTSSTSAAIEVHFDFAQGDLFNRFRQNPVWIQTEGGIAVLQQDPRARVNQRFKMMRDTPGS